MLIFDCDGVLVDSEPLACAVDAEVLTELGFSYTAGEIAARFVGTSLASMTAVIEAEHGRPLPECFSSRLEAALFVRFAVDLRPMAGVADLLTGLTGPRCVASSSTPARIALSLDVTGLAAFFEPGTVFSAVQVEHGKPAPDLFLFAAARMGIRPQECTVVEDSVPGVRAGVAAGMRVIGFTGGGHCGPGHAERLRAAGAAQVIASMQDLPEATTLL
jgi:HAD superfamily hydrolase (TIGR01509 family)